LEFRKTTLDNGLEIVAECNPDASSTALGFFVKTGSRDETDEIAGVSHFLEHMVFKGTPKRTAADVNREFDEMGAHYNAFTNEENTVFYAAVLPEYQDRTVELLGDILRPSLREDDFDTEKQVIIEEIRMYEDQPPFGANKKSRAAHYGEHPLARSVLGTVDSITDLSAGAMRDYFKRRYSPGNIALVSCGKVDFEALVAAAQEACGGWQPVETGRQMPPVESCGGVHVIQNEIATQEYAIQLADGPAAADDDRYAAKLLATVLGDETGSRLYWELVDPGLVEQASLSHYEYDGAGLFMTYLSCAPELIADNLALVRDIYRQAQDVGISEDELRQAKSKVCSRVVLSGERPRGRLFAVGGDWIQRSEYRTIRNDLDDVAALGLDDVAAVLAKYDLTKNTTVTIGPLAELPANG
jgi:predicted Zn-dependent peptidase